MRDDGISVEPPQPAGESDASQWRLQLERLALQTLPGDIVRVVLAVLTTGPLRNKVYLDLRETEKIVVQHELNRMACGIAQRAVRLARTAAHDALEMQLTHSTTAPAGKTN